MKSATAAPSLPAVPSSSSPNAGASHFADRRGLNSLLFANLSIEQRALPCATPARLSEASQRERTPQPETPVLTSDQPQTSPNEPPSILVLAVQSWGVLNYAEFRKFENEPGASTVSECLDAFRSQTNIFHLDKTRIRQATVAALTYMIKNSDMRTPFFNYASEFPRNAPDRILSILNEMKRAHLDHVERVHGKPMRALVSEANDKNEDSLDWDTPTYGPDANVWWTLSGLLKESVASIAAKKGTPQIDQKLTLRQLQHLFVTAGYTGNMNGFCSAHEVKKYVIKAVGKAPELILTLMLGYVKKNGEVKIFEVKAWIPRSPDGKLMENTIETKRPGLVAIEDDAEKIAPRYNVADVLFEHTPDGRYYSRDELSELPPCKSFWLYETAKRYSSSNIPAKRKYLPKTAALT